MNRQIKSQIIWLGREYGNNKAFSGILVGLKWDVQWPKRKKQNEEKRQKGRFLRKMKNWWNWKVKMSLDREMEDNIGISLKKEIEEELTKKSSSFMWKGRLKREE